MIVNKLVIPVFIPNKKIELILYGESKEDTLIEISDALENGESPFQIKEGCYYEYKITDGFSLETSEIVSISKFNNSTGLISPNIYVGTINISVLDIDKKKCGEVKIEVQSVKTNYREDYRQMLGEIAEKCTDLLLQYSSPASQNFEVNFNADANTLYQRFAFLKSIVDIAEFSDSVHKIISSPVTTWKESEIIKDIRGVKRFNKSVIRQMTSLSNRIELPTGHSLKTIINSIPHKIKVSNKTETVDTPENRFVKHALVSFQSLCNDFKRKSNCNDRIKIEADMLEDNLEQILSHALFKEISSPKTLPLNSPVLQRKEGYREIFRTWLMFDLAARLLWRGGDDVYSANKRDVAVLYEYWIFFKLLDIIKEIFKIETKSLKELIKETSDGLGLQLKQGIHIPIKGIYETGTRKLNVEFSYNKTFSGDNSYPASGSWTKTMRPDYTLSIWPHGINQEEAEREELITHIHFDAKYKVEDKTDIFGIDEDFNNEKDEQRKGTYKRADLLKMHTYKDAIRRTAGSYVIYPGSGSSYTKIGFHEIIPGLGAFSLRPSKTESGIEELKKFLNEVLLHFLNRASQREKMYLKTYEIYKEKNSSQLNEVLPETSGKNRSLIPDETFVLVGYYKRENLDWIIKNGLYNARAENARGSLRLGPGESGAKYLLLHTEGEIITNKLFKITETGPRIFSKQTLIEKKYPTIPSQNYYLVYRIEESIEDEFKNKKWDISKLENFKSGRGSGLPFAITLTELMLALKKND